jgi:hypothetical protein
MEQLRTLDDLKEQIEQQRKILEEVKREAALRPVEPAFSAVKPEIKDHGGAWQLHSKAV